MLFRETVWDLFQSWPCCTNTNQGRKGENGRRKKWHTTTLQAFPNRAGSTGGGGTCWFVISWLSVQTLAGSVPLCVQQSQEQLTDFWIQSCVSRTWLQMFGLLLLLLLAKPCLSSWGDSSSYHQVLHPCSAYPTFNLSHSGLLTPLSRVNGKWLWLHMHVGHSGCDGWAAQPGFLIHLSAY